MRIFLFCQKPLGMAADHISNILPHVYLCENPAIQFLFVLGTTLNTLLSLLVKNKNEILAKTIIMNKI